VGDVAFKTLDLEGSHVAVFLTRTLVPHIVTRQRVGMDR
jgi:hypothetical protein